jgi:hypothetical protein
VTDVKMQRLLMWGTVISFLLFTIGFVPLARILPPTPPSKSADQVVQFWSEDTDLKRLGLILMLTALGLGLGFFVVIFLQMRRVEGGSTPLAYLQLVAGVLSAVPGLIGFLAWCVLAFRPDRGDPPLVLAINDLGWFGFMIGQIAFVQVIAIALCAFRDSEQKVFPRWVGYYNMWVAVSFLPGYFFIYFKHGPLAWNGLLVFWVPVAIFAPWVVIMIVVMFRAISGQEKEEQSRGRRAALGQTEVSA